MALNIHRYGSASENDDLCDARIFETALYDLITDHPGRPCNDDLHYETLSITGLNTGTVVVECMNIGLSCRLKRERGETEENE
jgi:hypothetical protein